MTKIVSILSGVAHKTTGNVHLSFIDHEQHPFPLEIQRACAAPMAVMITSLLKATREQFKEKSEFQPFTLTEARKISGPDDSLHLTLTLDHSLDICIFLNENTVAGLQSLLSELQKSGRLKKGSQAH